MKLLTLLTAVAIVVSVPTEARNNHNGGHYAGTGSNPNSHTVRGYSKRDGTYVQPHHQTNPNHTKRDNYNAHGNYNPHNGQTGRNYVDR